MMKVIEKNGVRYVDYSLSNLDHLMSYLIGKALKEHKVNISVKDYENLVESKEKGSFRRKAIFTFDNRLDVIMINVPDVKGKNIDLSFVKKSYEGDYLTESGEDDYTGVPVKRISDKEFNEIMNYFEKNVLPIKPKNLEEYAVVVLYTHIEFFNFKEWEYFDKIYHVSELSS